MPIYQYAYFSIFRFTVSRSITLLHWRFWLRETPWTGPLNYEPECVTLRKGDGVWPVLGVHQGGTQEDQFLAAEFITSLFSDN